MGFDALGFAIERERLFAKIGLERGCLPELRGCVIDREGERRIRLARVVSPLCGEAGRCVLATPGIS